MDKEHYEALLKEYEVSQAFSTQMGNQVWQTASIFIALSLAGIALLGEGSVHSWARLAVITVVGLASISILALWGRILRRWTSFDAITQYRMREIEAELGMWKNRYIDQMDSTMRGEEEDLTANQDAETKERLTRLVQTNRSTYSYRSGGRAVTRIRQILMLAWAAMILSEAVFTLLRK
jgi:hypothetical protein